MFEVHVEHLSAPGMENSLRAFSIGVRRIAVMEIIDRWPAASHEYIKLLGDDGALYILRHDEGSKRWELTLFQA
ncbi:MAG: hypothetical protein V4632_17045 [Pseudomonadota bacterium]